MSHIVRRMIGFYDHLSTAESPIIIDSLKLSVELNEEDKTSWFTSVKKSWSPEYPYWPISKLKSNT